MVPDHRRREQANLPAGAPPRLLLLIPVIKFECCSKMEIIYAKKQVRQLHASLPLHAVIKGSAWLAPRHTLASCVPARLQVSLQTLPDICTAMFGEYARSAREAVHAGPPFARDLAPLHPLSQMNHAQCCLSKLPGKG